MSRFANPFVINFVTKDQDLALRHWPGVPRIGELVLLADRKTTYVVKQICWGVREEAEKDGRVELNILVEKEGTDR